MSNAVENPIVNGPFEEPSLHYDFTGAEPRVSEGRRPAGYYGVPNTRDVRGALAANPFMELQRVNEIRARVKAWRERRWPGATPVTRDLLEHWYRPDRRPLFFAQREAAETIIWLTEASPADRQGIEIPADAPVDRESIDKGYAALRRYCTKMATGTGKTTVMAMVAAWSILNKLANKQDARFTDAVLVVCPNLTVRERLQVLKPNVPASYYAAFDLVPQGYRDLLARGRVLVTNWHVFAVQDDTGTRGVVKKGRESDAAFVRRVLDRDLGRSGEILVLNDEAHHAYRPAPRPEEEPDQLEIGLTADERKQAEELAAEATVWVGGLDRIHKVRGIKMVVDLSATPFFLKGTGHREGDPLPWIVSDFGLVDAIEAGLTKIPRIPIASNSGAPDPEYFRLWQHIMDRLPQSERETAGHRAKPESVWTLAEPAFAMLASKWKETLAHFQASGYPVPPVLIVVAANTDLSKIVEEAVKRGDVLSELARDNTFRIDSKALAEAEVEDGGSKQDAAERLRLTTATVGKAAWPDGKPPEGWEATEPPGKNIRCVVSVGMLTEGWDAQNVTQILGLRAFASQLLCEQVVGRALRRMNYDVDPETGRFAPEYADIFGVPFEVIPVKGVAPKQATPLPPSTLIQPLPSRQGLAIEFPRVEGYVMDVKQRLRCDVTSVAELRVEPQVVPTQMDVRSRVDPSNPVSMAGEAEALTRAEFYDEHRLQRTAFEIARDITEVLAGGKSAAATGATARTTLEGARLLFPAVLRIVMEYLTTRVVLAPGARIEEVALAKYRGAIVSRLLDAIEPDVNADEAPLLPRIERFRPTGSTGDVQFRTSRQTMSTFRSHLSHVVLDSGAYGEGQAVWQLEHCSRVIAYAKNDHLDFEIPYEWEGATHVYRPDFLVRISSADGELNLMVEIKGQEREQDRAKYEAAKKWVRAVNYHGGYGTWAFTVCKEPNRLGQMLDGFGGGVAKTVVSEQAL